MPTSPASAPAFAADLIYSTGVSYQALQTSYSSNSCLYAASDSYQANFKIRRLNSGHTTEEYHHRQLQFLLLPNLHK